MRSISYIVVSLLVCASSLVEAKVSYRPRAVSAGSSHSHSIRSVGNLPHLPGRRLRQRKQRRSAIRAASLQKRVVDTSVLLGQLQSLSTGMIQQQSAIHSLATQLQNDPSLAQSGPFSSSVANQLKAWRDANKATTPIISKLDVAFAQFGAGKGALNYDKNNGLETLLQKINNSIKYTLSDIDYFVYQIPGLGPVLGPIVYDVKCLVDELLDGSQNTIDSLLNGQSIAPELQSLTVALGLAAAQLGLPITA